MIFHLHFGYSLDQSRRRQLVLYRMCIYLSSIELKFDRIAGNLQGVRHCCKPPVSVLMRVVVLNCKRDRLARFDFAEASEHFCLEVLACCHVWESRLAFAGGSLALAAKVPPSRSLVERRCPSLSISRTDPRRTRLQEQRAARQQGPLYLVASCPGCLWYHGNIAQWCKQCADAAQWVPLYR